MTAEPQWIDLDEWADQATGEATDDELIRRTNPGHTEIWWRGFLTAPEAFTEAGCNRFVFTPSDTRSGRVRVSKQYEMLRGVAPEGQPFTWLSFSPERVHWQTSERYEATEQPLRVPLWTYGDDPKNLLSYAARAEEMAWPLIACAFFPHHNSRQDEAATAYEFVHRVAAANPAAPIHLAFPRRYSYAFGLNFASADFNPVKEARYGGVILPNGRQARPAGIRRYLKWLHVVGFSPKDLESFEGRLRFNIASAIWASEHWNDRDPLAPTNGARDRGDPLGLWDQPPARAGTVRKADRLTYRRMPHRPFLPVDEFPQFAANPDPYAYAEPVTNLDPVPVTPRGGDTVKDKVTCNTCSLARTCRLYREGSVCTMPESPTARLATMFGTRDVDTVREALTAVLAAQSDRYERSATTFREDDESDVKDLKRSAHLMRMENSLLRNIETLVKILDPGYRPNALASIDASNTMNVYNPQILVATVVKELEARGISRDQIDIGKVLEVIQHAPNLIPGEIER